MTDQIPADKVRGILDGMRESMRRAEGDCTNSKFMGSMAVYVAALASLLPTPPRPTLADMTDDERANAVGMWADVEGFHPYRAVIGGIPAPKVPVFRPTDGSLDWVHPDDVTPLPELGRAWSPGGSPTGTPAPAPALPEGWRLADHKDHGRVIVTSDVPNTAGHLCFVLPAVDPMGYDWLFCDPDELTYIDQKPEDVTPAQVGDVIESADDPRISALPVDSILLDRHAEATTKRRGGWEGRGYIPIPSEGDVYGPWTVLHIPKEEA